MIHNVLRLIFICVTLIPVLSKASPIAVEGVIDLNQQAVDKGNAIHLDGQWQYVLGKLLTPHEFLEHTTKYPERYLFVPGSFKNLKDYSVGENGMELATLSLYIQNLSDSEQFILEIPELPSSYRLFVNGKEQISRGTPSEILEEHTPLGGTQNILLDKGGNYHLILQVANYQHNSFGVWWSPKIWDREAYQQYRKSKEGVNGIFLGFLSVMGIYHFILFLIRPKLISPLLFSLFCFAIALRTSCVFGEGFMYALIPDLSWRMGKVLEYVSFYLCIPLFISFTASLYPKQIKPWNIKVSWFVGLIFTIPTLILDVRIFTTLMVYFQMYAAIHPPLIVFFAIKGFFLKEEGAKTFLVGTVIILAGLTHDVLDATGIISSAPLAEVAVSLFILCQSVLLAQRFSNAFQRAEDGEEKISKLNRKLVAFNEDLEHQVEQKTRKVRALLDYIPQGILTIGKDGRIGDNVSKHLHQILGIRTICGYSFKDVVLSKSELSEDRRDQIMNTLSVSIGEDPFNFEANEDKLPGEITVVVHGQLKYLKTTWNLEVVDDVVDSILVTFHDITMEKTLEKEAELKRQELIKVEQLLSIDEVKSSQFFSSSYELLDEILLQIESAVILDDDTIRLLFINAHTIKGAARTLRLDGLSDSLHNLESEFTKILQGSTQYNQSFLMSIAAKVENVFEDYHRINRDKLNRGNNDKMAIDRSMVENHYYFIKDLIDQNLTIGEVVTALKSQERLISEAIFETLPLVVEEYRDRAIKIARDIGKAEPVLKFNVPDISISTEQKNTLDKCMIHLMRNALDHGIEHPNERAALGKPSRGAISIDFIVNKDQLLMKLTDDGRGLALRDLQEKGEKTGILNSKSSPLEIAESIFHCGITTARGLTNISGRGVGMRAVKAFVEEEGGSVRVKLGDEKRDRPGFYDFHFELSIPLYRSNTVLTG